ncbi:hypothetical protein [Oceaniglobus trochenteri]|uniref:hypothetical protein n=1 Tax=Oceaniglobus trochenteri TaxID=2763260 RepID=UPI001CFF5D4A|nr:hypothetical protein [Oceaniglobus trochenteri]
MFRILATTAAFALASPALADDVTDTLQSAIDAYSEGDIAYALEEIAFATQLIKAQKAGALNAFLPEAQAGWTREIDEDEGRSLGMMGGTGAVARYSNGDDSFNIQIMADSPMIAGFAGVFGNAGMMATMGKIERVGREKFLNQDGELTGIVAGRILVQASGGDVDTMIAHLEAMDFKGLAGFGS